MIRTDTVAAIALAAFLGAGPSIAGDSASIAPMTTTGYVAPSAGHAIRADHAANADNAVHADSAARLDSGLPEPFDPNICGTKDTRRCSSAVRLPVGEYLVSCEGSGSDWGGRHTRRILVTGDTRWYATCPQDASGGVGIRAYKISSIKRLF